MAIVTEKCSICDGTGWVKHSCCEWCGSYDVARCIGCDGNGEEIWDDEYVPTFYGPGSSSLDLFPLISVQRGGISYAQRTAAPPPAYPPLEDRVDLWV